MKTPICDFVKQYADRQTLRLHMPGHKGQKRLGAEHLDITEIDGADVLYQAKGIIRESENYAAELFGSARTLYSAEGSSLSIRAMLHMAMLYAQKMRRRPLIAAGRNAHKTFMTAAALLDFEIEWLYPEYRDSVISCEITPLVLERFLTGRTPEDMPAALYVTSPDYLGNCLDIRGLSRVCREKQILLLVDNAHGAYLHFLSESQHPIALGADLCCDSAHKTLPVLTGGGYLHISQKAPRLFIDQAEQAMALFASTSPSYLILQSLDYANLYLSEGYREALLDFAKSVSRLKSRLTELGYYLIGNEPMKLTVAPKSYGYTGKALAEWLLERGIVCEFYDPDFMVMMLTPDVGEAGLAMLEQFFCELPRKAPISECPPMNCPAERVMSVRQAMFSNSYEVEVSQCCGKVLASANVACPPAIPIAMCGERLDEAAVRCFQYYGITSCRIVDD